MRSWRREPEPPPPGDPATMEELRRRMAAADGPLPPGAHRHGDEIHWEAHTHPHVGSPDDGRPVIGIVGAGAVGTAIGVALSRAGWQVGAVASRDAGRRERFRALVPGSRAFPEAAAILDECHLAVLAVPDDVLAGLAATLHLYSGQAVVHTSGLHGADVLEPALAAGTSAGSFHPLVAFADLDRALAALPGATVAIEGDDAILDLLAEMATSIGAVPVRLAPGSKAAYHAAAVLAAGGLTALLDVLAEVGGPHGPRRGGSPGHLRSAGGPGPGQRRGPGDRPGADRSRGPRRRRDDRRPPRRGGASRRRGAGRLSLARPAPGHDGRVAARSRTGCGGPGPRRVHKEPLTG